MPVVKCPILIVIEVLIIMRRLHGLSLLMLILLALTACGGLTAGLSTPTVWPRETFTSFPPTATITPCSTPTPISVPPTLTPTQTPTPKPYPPYRRPSPKETPFPFAISLKTYEGPGYSFQYPANARVENPTPWPPVASVIRVIGPVVWVKPGDADWSYNGPAYELTIQTYENPEGLDAETWARDYILKVWKEARERNEPWGSLPVTEEGVVKKDKVGRYVVAGQPAFWVNYFAFDSEYPAFYLAGNSQVVELSFSDYPLENQPLAVMQQDVYALIIGTFRLKEK